MFEQDGRHDFDLLHGRWHFQNERLDGSDIKAHFVWAGVDTAHPTWLPEDSAAGGQSWEVNWRMTLTRIDEEPEAMWDAAISYPPLLPLRSSLAGVA